MDLNCEGSKITYPFKLTGVGSALPYLEFITLGDKPVWISEIHWGNLSDVTLSFFDIAVSKLDTEGTWGTPIVGVKANPNAGTPSLTVNSALTAGSPTFVANSDLIRKGVANSREWVSYRGFWIPAASKYALRFPTAPAAHTAVGEIVTQEFF